MPYEEYPQPVISPGLIGASASEQRTAGVNEHDNAASASNKVKKLRDDQAELDRLTPGGGNTLKALMVIGIGIVLVVGAPTAVDAYRNPYSVLMAVAGPEFACNRLGTSLAASTALAPEVYLALPEYRDVHHEYRFDRKISGHEAAGTLKISYGGKALTAPVKCVQAIQGGRLEIASAGDFAPPLPAEFRRVEFPVFSYLTGVTPTQRFAELRRNPARVKEICDAAGSDSSTCSALHRRD